MCLYPKLIKNKKYQSTKKNGGIVPPCPDERLRYVTAACGKCYECRRQSGRAWQIRMCEELKSEPNAIFITLTLSDDSFRELETAARSKDENTVAKVAIRRFLERIRKETGKSMRHWFITEKGHEGTKRLHLHGICWGKGTRELVKNHWKYGHIFIGDYVDESTMNYITKYMTKKDEDNDGFVGKVFCSAGIGKGYIDSMNAENNRYKEGGQTSEAYRLKSGVKLNLPIYYRNKLYTEKERELLFIEKINAGERFICGQKVRVDDEAAYMNLLEVYRDKHQRISGDDPVKWDRDKYIKQMRKQREYYNRVRTSSDS